MPERGLLRHLIAEQCTTDSLARIKDLLHEHSTHHMLPVANGLFAASPSQTANSLTGYQNAWIRDNVMVANSFRLRGDVATAIACVQGMTRFLETQLPRFREIIDDPSHELRNDANRRPHIRFLANTLAELPEKWPQAQNDALGHVLWLRFVLANSGEMALTQLDMDVYGMFPAYFEAIEYWRDRDSGAWEEGRKINNSSVGAVVVGLEELLRYQTCAQASRHGVRPPESQHHDLVPLGAITPTRLEALIAKGRERLDQTLPFESPPERLVDSALLFLIHPLGAVRSRAAQNAILNLVQARLKGAVGIKRYVGDSYFCQDYDEWFAPDEMSSDFSERLDFRDAHLQPNCEAQWCIFDPLLSVIYGERYLVDCSDRQSFQKQVHYFNRSLAQVTAAVECPELYFLKNGSYIANTHTPLTWTQANQALALHLMEKSLGDQR